MDVILDFFCCLEMASWPRREAFSNRAEHRNDVGRGAAGELAEFAHPVMCNLLSSNRSDRLGGHAVAMVETTDSRHR